MKVEIRNRHKSAFTKSITPNSTRGRSIVMSQTATTTKYDTVEEEETEEVVTPEEVTEEEATRDPAPVETTATSIKMILYDPSLILQGHTLYIERDMTIERIRHVIR